MWESVKNWSRVWKKRWLATGPRNWLTSGDSPEFVTHVEHAGSWRVKTTRSLQDKKYSLAILLTGYWNSQLVPVASDSLHPILQKNDFSHSFSYPTINTLIPTKCKEFLERILREKSQRTIRLIHPQSYTFDSSNSSTLTFSIDIPLKGSLAKSLPQHRHISEKFLGVWEAVQERTNSFWFMQWAYCKIL